MDGDRQKEFNMPNALLMKEQKVLNFFAAFIGVHVTPKDPWKGCTQSCFLIREHFLLFELLQTFTRKKLFSLMKKKLLTQQMLKQLWPAWLLHFSIHHYLCCDRNKLCLKKIPDTGVHNWKETLASVSMMENWLLLPLCCVLFLVIPLLQTHNFFLG